MTANSFQANRRQLLQTLAAGAAGATLPLGMGGRAFAANKRVALVVKNLGNSYFDACRDGANQAAKEIGGMEIIYTAPTKPTAEDQIAVLDSLIAQKVDGLIIAADDANALVPVGKKAMQRGIKVISYDSAVAPGGRLMHLSASSTPLIGAKQVQMIEGRPQRRGRGRDPVGRLHHDEPEQLDRGHEGRVEEARIREDAARRDRLRRRPGRQELSRDAGAGEGAPEPEGRDLSRRRSAFVPAPRPSWTAA